MPTNSDTPRCWNCSLDLSKVKLVRVQEAAQLCEVDSRTVRRWMEEGNVEWLRLPHGKPRIVSDTLPTGNRKPVTGYRNPAEGGNQNRRNPSAGLRSPVSGLLPACFVCGRPTQHSRILLDIDQARHICRVKRRTVAGWANDGQVETEQGCFYLDSLFQEPRRHRDLDVRG